MTTTRILQPHSQKWVTPQHIVKNKHTLRPVRRNRPASADYTIRPVHHRETVTVERRTKSPSLPWKASVGRYLALGATLNEVIANLFVKAITQNPNA